MGNTQTQPSRTDIVDLTSLVDAKSPVLSEELAFTLATIWNSDLRDVWWLSGDSPIVDMPHTGRRYPDRPLDSDFAITQIIEYVDFSFHWLVLDDLVRKVAAARAATLVWFALSCCPGFRGTENPTFWWQVFSKRTTPPTRDVPPWNSDWAKAHVVDSHAFFPHPDRPFPRVRIRGLDNNLSLFFHGTHIPQAIQEQLTSALQVLDPFITDERWENDLPVAICFLDGYQDVKDVLEEARRVQRPWIRLTQVYCVNEEPEDLGALDALVETTDIKVSFATSKEALSIIRGPGGSLGGTSRIFIEELDLGTTAFKRKRSRVKYFGTCCSALPHSHGIQGIKVLHQRHDPVLTDVNAAWLGYAIFHPDAVANDRSFSNLMLRVDPTCRSAMEVLACMAKGNNLIVPKDPSTVLRTAYCQARVRAGTIVRSKPTESATIHVMCDSEMWMTICSSNLGETSDGWIRIVLPGHGLGWIHTSDILETVERAPGPSCVRCLCLIISSDEEGVTRDLLLSVLSVLGSRLEHLKLMFAYREMDLSTEAMCDILEHCPYLRSLHVPHDGSCWTKKKMTLLPNKPQLEELELAVNDNLQLLVAPQLSDLKVFRLQSDVIRPMRHNAIQTAFLSLLKQYPQLELLMWFAKGAKAWITFRPYNATHYLIQNAIVPGMHDHTLVPLDRSSRVAFLSVIAAKNHSSEALGHLGADIASHIFRFCSSSTPRKFHITIK